MPSRSRTKVLCEASAGAGGWTRHPMASWPTTLEQSEMEASLTSCALTTGSQAPSSAAKPPRSPHSPQNPLEVECIETSCTRAARAGSDARSAPSARRKEWNWFSLAVPGVLYTLSWYTSSAISTSPSRAAKARISVTSRRDMHWPVGLPGLMMTRPRGRAPRERASSRERWRSSTETVHSPVAGSSDSGYSAAAPSASVDSAE
mmetsp:Transcript_7899/g.25899  ORF Transcript_7899/g.25899 Transcript_7899/m.25899 type:complete len:204 (-) Transcript_7899:651-1262(-)